MNNESNKGRFYPIVFILLIIIVTFMYASLASNFGIKINNDKYLEPTDNPDTSEKTDDIIDNSSRSDDSPSKTSRNDSIPVIEPDNINWRIEFENIKVDNDSIVAVSDAHILETKTEVNYRVVLNEPGQKYSFDVDVANRGNIDAKIYGTSLTGLNSEQEKYIKYNVTYKGGASIKEDDLLLANNIKTIHLEVEFKDDIEASDLPKEDQELNLTYKITYVEK